MADVAPIRTAGLTKTYRSGNSTVHAVVELELELESGEFFGLLGPNGAGHKYP